MNITQKCQYALRAVFELARQNDQQPVRIAAIAEAQAIPVRFLEVILNELKHGGFVDSRRGSQGGYYLTVDPRELTAGKIITFVDGPIRPVSCQSHLTESRCPLETNCVFYQMWDRAAEALTGVFESFTFYDLVACASPQQEYALNYSI